jgi:penicillin-binding protein 2
MVNTFSLIFFLNFILSFVMSAQENIQNPSATRTLSEARIIHLRVPAPRGLIVDQKGKVLVQNKIFYRLGLRLPYFDIENPNQLRELQKFLQAKISEAHQVFSQNIKVNWDLFLEHYRQRRWLPFFMPITVDEKSKAKIQTQLQIQNFEPGWVLEAMYVRHYPNPYTASHVLGTVGKLRPMSRTELIKLEYDLEDAVQEKHSDSEKTEKLYQEAIQKLDPLTEDYVGRDGLEFAYDRELRGEDGLIKIVIDENGNEVSRQILQAPKVGQTLVTTLNLNWQLLSEKLLAQKKQRSAFIVLDIKKGSIAAMASYPTFDLTKFVPYLDDKYAKFLNEDPSNPLLGRAWQGRYPPGSVFKIPVALAALEKNIFEIPLKIRSLMTS